MLDFLKHLMSYIYQRYKERFTATMVSNIFLFGDFIYDGLQQRYIQNLMLSSLKHSIILSILETNKYFQQLC